MAVISTADEMTVIYFIGENLHERLKLFSRKNKHNIINLSSAKLAQRVVHVKRVQNAQRRPCQTAHMPIATG